MLDRSLENDLPQIIWDMEPDSPGAKWVPLQTVPEPDERAAEEQSGGQEGET